MNRYWLKIKYEDGFERWELTQGKYTNADAANKAYGPRAKALDFEIVELKPHEQLKLDFQD
jgi:hypothetical protein